MPRLPISLSAPGRGRLTSQAAEVVEETLLGLYRQHPEWEARCGGRGRDFCREDLHYQLEYLRIYLETGYAEPFREYARRLAGVLQGRGITPRHLSESFERLSEAWARRDTGVGITEQDQVRIFDAFAQVENQTQSRAKRTGLGLTRSRQLAELLGGEVSMNSRPGIGSTFRLRLPTIYNGPDEADIQSLPSGASP